MPGPPFFWPMMRQRPRKPEPLWRLVVLLIGGAVLVLAIIIGLSLF